ncbi:MAG TPA: c-type cytochrome domain-containing protein [Pirellulales bacterium]|nr:c-type cytochrome domain-containing protein [Pirellulales bacterium]
MFWSCAVAASVMIVSRAGAELRPEDQQKIDAIDESLHKAATLYRTKKFADLGKLVEQVETSLGELKETVNPDLAPTLSGLEVRVAAAQRLLRASLDHAAPAKPATKPVAKMPAKAKTAPPGGISYVNDIAPLLADRCGNCHITQSKGGFNVGTYAALRQGSSSGTVFNPGKGSGSTLVDLIESGDMPRGGGKLSDADISMIVKWIDNGAVFDGADPTAMVASAASNMPMSDMPSGGESISFLRDIAPILSDHCTDCHGGERGQANFELGTFAQLKKGGRTGDVLNPGKPNRSLLLNMLKGKAKDAMGKTRPQMPRNKSPLSDEQIAKFETWISEGAKFDGGDQNVEIDYLVRQYRASKMNHEELLAYRTELAKQNWIKGSPGVSVDKVEMEDFTVYGNMTPVVLKDVAERIVRERSKISNVLRLTPGKPLVKGGVSIFVFEKRFELTEFARMLDHRELTSDTAGFFVYDVIDAYAGILLPKDDDQTFSLLVAESFCGLHVASLGKNVPKWFANGAGRVYGAKVEPRSAMVKRWDDSVASALSGAKPTFVGAKNPDGEQVALSYGLVKSMSTSSKFNTLLEMLRKGANFNQALMQVYGSNAQGLAAAWLR